MLNASEYEFLKAHYSSFGKGVLKVFKDGGSEELLELTPEVLVKSLKKRLNTEVSKDMALGIALIAFLLYCQED